MRPAQDVENGGANVWAAGRHLSCGICQSLSLLCYCFRVTPQDIILVNKIVAHLLWLKILWPYTAVMMSYSLWTSIPWTPQECTVCIPVKVTYGLFVSLHNICSNYCLGTQTSAGVQPITSCCRRVFILHAHSNLRHHPPERFPHCIATMVNSRLYIMPTQHVSLQCLSVTHTNVDSPDPWGESPLSIVCSFCKPKEATAGGGSCSLCR